MLTCIAHLLFIFLSDFILSGSKILPTHRLYFWRILSQKLNLSRICKVWLSERNLNNSGESRNLSSSFLRRGKNVRRSSEFFQLCILEKQDLKWLQVTFLCELDFKRLFFLFTRPFRLPYTLKLQHKGGVRPVRPDSPPAPFSIHSHFTKAT